MWCIFYKYGINLFSSCCKTAGMAMVKHVLVKGTRPRPCIRSKNCTIVLPRLTFSPTPCTVCPNPLGYCSVTMRGMFSSLLASTEGEVDYKVSQIIFLPSRLVFLTMPSKFWITGANLSFENIHMSQIICFTCISQTKSAVLSGSSRPHLWVLLAPAISWWLNSGATTERKCIRKYNKLWLPCGHWTKVYLLPLHEKIFLMD